MSTDRMAITGPSTPSRGRPTKHGLTAMRKTLRTLTTKRVDGRSAVAVAVRSWKADIRRDLGGDLTRAQETILEAAAQSWVILSSLDDYIARQPSLVTKKRQVVPVVLQRMQIADSLGRHLERLGLERRAHDVADLKTYLARRTPASDEEDEGSTPSTHRRGDGEGRGA